MSMDDALLRIIDVFAESYRWESEELGLTPGEHMAKQTVNFVELAKLISEADKPQE